MKKFFAIVPLLAALGCQTTEIVGPNFTVTRKSFLAQSAFAELHVTLRTNEVSFGLGGYRTDQAQAVGIAVEAAIRAAIASAKP